MRNRNWSLRRAGILASFGLAVSLMAGSAESPQAALLNLGSEHQAPESSSKHKSKHADDFLVHGTVFTHLGFAFAGIQLRIRRSNEKKFRWNTYTNSRGEFAVRVKQGTKYVVVVRKKGFKEQSKEIDATLGNSTDDIVFRMEPEEGGKK